MGHNTTQTCAHEPARAIFRMRALLSAFGVFAPFFRATKPQWPVDAGLRKWAGVPCRSRCAVVCASVHGCRCGMEFRRSNCLQRQGLAHCTERCCTAAFALLRIRLIALAMQGGSPDVGREPLHQFQDDLHAHPVRARATACERLRSEQQPVMSRCVALCMCSQYMPRWRRTQVHLHGPVIESSSF